MRTEKKKICQLCYNLKAKGGGEKKVREFLPPTCHNALTERPIKGKKQKRALSPRKTGSV